MVNPIKYGLILPRDEKVEAIPLIPARKANTGVMQHKEATIEANIAATQVLCDVFSVLKGNKLCFF